MLVVAPSGRKLPLTSSVKTQLPNEAAASSRSISVGW